MVFRQVEEKWKCYETNVKHKLWERNKVVKETKLSFTDDMIVYMENAKESTDKLLELISELNKFLI